MIWWSGYSRITKFIISERLDHMVAPWLRTGVWKLGFLTVLVGCLTQISGLRGSPEACRSSFRRKCLTHRHIAVSFHNATETHEIHTSMHFSKSRLFRCFVELRCLPYFTMFSWNHFYFRFFASYVYLKNWSGVDGSHFRLWTHNKVVGHDKICPLTRSKNNRQRHLSMSKQTISDFSEISITLILWSEVYNDILDLNRTWYVNL